jgi:hypothetical protein
MIIDIVPEDLIDTPRLLALFEQAHTQELIGKSDSERLTFLSLAEHAQVVGSHNPCGLFAELIRRQCWHFVTESDEDAAYKRLKLHLYGESDQKRPTPPPAIIEPPDLSKDAFIVRELQRELERRGFRGDVFAWLHWGDASWTRERWDTAVLELEQAKRAWQQASGAPLVARWHKKFARRLADAQKGDTQLQRDISVSLDKIGDVKRSQNDNAGALAAYDESLAIARHLAAVDPGNVQWQTDLVVSLYKVAILADGEKKCCKTKQ